MNPQLLALIRNVGNFINGRRQPKKEERELLISPAVLSSGQSFNEFDSNYYMTKNFIPRRVYADMDISQLLDGRMLNYAQILTILPDIDADVSMALWNMVRLANSGWTVTAYRGENSEAVDKRAQKLLEEFLDQVNMQYGGFDNLINQWTGSQYLQGAVCGELVLDEKTKRVVDIMPLNPSSIYFKVDPETKKLKPYQYQPNPDRNKNVVVEMNYVELNPLTFWYVPLDPAIGDPYGRSPASPAIADVFFNLRVLFDLKRVVHNQGWPRLDVSVVTETLYKNAPQSVQMDTKKLDAYVRAGINQIKRDYETLKPDDTFIHTDAIKVGSVAATGQGSAFDATALLRSIERRVIRALKQLPMLMGSNEGTTETHGTVQYEIYVKGIESLQKNTEKMVEGMLEFFLRMEGIQSTVEFEFNKIETRNRKADAEAEKIEIENAKSKIAEGWIDNTEASIQITGSEPVLTDEELAARKLAMTPTALPANTNSDSTSVPADNKEEKNARSGGDKPQRPTITRAKEEFKGIRSQFLEMLNVSFDKVEKALPSETIIREVYRRFPKSPENTLPLTNKIDTNSPIYSQITSVVSEFFERDKTEKLLENMSEDGARILIEAFENYGQRALIGMASHDKRYAFAEFKLNDLGMRDLVESRAEYFPQSVFETTQKEIANTVMRGYQEGKSVNDIASDLRSKFDDMRTNRSVLIANTELNWTTSQGTLQTMIKNKVAKKRWQTVDDDRVRPEHAANQAQGAIPVTQAFSSGDDAPPAAPNCRCTLVEVVDDDWVAPGEVWSGGE